MGTSPELVLYFLDLIPKLLANKSLFFIEYQALDICHSNRKHANTGNEHGDPLKHLLAFLAAVVMDK
jgi:hypothetical protein